MFNVEEIAAIFGNIEQIYQFAGLFLSDLEKAFQQQKPHETEIGNCFIKHVSTVAIEVVFSTD
jgi:Rho guanine nucleotide exchange factor 4